MQKFNYNILYAEDDDATRKNYTELLTFYFNNVYQAKDGAEAYTLFVKHKPEIVILDINMPIIDGLTVAKRIRNLNKDVKIIMLTALDDKTQLLDAIKIQVSGYLVKPVKTIEFESMLLKINKQLTKKENKNNKLSLPDNITWDKDKQTLYQNNQMVKLTKKEHLLISLLCSNETKIFETDMILNSVWEDTINDDYDTKALRALISRIKQKLGTQIFESIYNVGYKIKISQTNNNERV
jgi:DNA-binding response OmpR family regulator